MNSGSCSQISSSCNCPICVFAWFASSCRSPLLKGKIIINKRQQTTRYLFQTKNRSTLVFYQAQPVPYSTSYLRSLTFTAMSAYPSIPVWFVPYFFFKIGTNCYPLLWTLAVLSGQAQISWLVGHNDKYTLQHIRIPWTTVLLNKQPECRYRVHTKKKLKISLQYIKHF